MLKRSIKEAVDVIRTLYTTLAYRAPEMVDLYSGVAIGPPVDIWALGCILYALCFFALPFGSGSALAIQTGRYTVPASASTSYSSRLLKLMRELSIVYCFSELLVNTETLQWKLFNVFAFLKMLKTEYRVDIADYMLTISGVERPDIYQVSFLAFSLLGRPNPVPNVNSTKAPDWQSLSLPNTDIVNTSSKSSSVSYPTSSSTVGVNLEGSHRANLLVSFCRQFTEVLNASTTSTSTLPEPSMTIPIKTTTVSPSIARQRPRAVVNPTSTAAINAIAKPPNPPRSSTAFQNSIHLTNILKSPQQQSGVIASTKASPPHRVGHRRGLSEASALLLNASNVRQTHSLGDLQPNFNTMNAKSATLGARIIHTVADDIDGDLFGAAFDAIRNQSAAANKVRVVVLLESHLEDLLSRTYSSLSTLQQRNDIGRNRMNFGQLKDEPK
ncbi:unnamed protein product [Hydatigera taeniaeformis]|uniref:non-specific serine/threonine protein kinase n=1 Tax=Hydatigena taeniaeformis TaxID=6205 RepID=A0A0R3X4V7_HYDTA|nr:unnamed protein product [Hydatigera taeniaeformis]